VPSILPEVHRDQVRASQHGGVGRGDDFGKPGAPRLPHGRHVIDVHTKTNHGVSIS